jgi:hypothetical protein
MDFKWNDESLAFLLSKLSIYKYQLHLQCIIDGYMNIFQNDMLNRAWQLNWKGKVDRILILPIL